MALASRWWFGREGRRARRAARGETRGALGLAALAALAALCALAGALAGAPTAPEAPVARRALALQAPEFFRIRAEHCQDTAQWYAAALLAAAVYTFVGLFVVVDEYFEPTLLLLSKALGLSEDVAGATFMAVGSSSPELVLSFVDAFVTQASVGLGTVLGSAMFNLLVIVGGTVFAGGGKSPEGGPLKVSAFPLGRDSSFYVAALGVLAVVVLNDGKLCVLQRDTLDIYANRTDQLGEPLFCYVGLVSSVEGLLLFLCYLVYVFFMIFNRGIEKWWNERVSFRCCGMLGRPTKTVVEDRQLAALAEGVARAQREPSLDWGEAERPRSARAAKDGAAADDDEDDEDRYPRGPLRERPQGVGGLVFWLLALPFRALLFCTVPTCLRPGHLRNALCFVACIAWIAALSTAMLYTGTFAGCLLHFDPFMTGLVFLAIGTSMPDAVASFVVARGGRGGMAISNAVGSNIFDVLVGLGLPWLIAGVALRPRVNAPDGKREGQFVVTNGMGVALLWIASALAVLWGGLVLSRWTLNKALGAALILYYLVFLVFLLLVAGCKIPICMELDCERCGAGAGGPSLLG
jgi:K+-dependent Na+/Ca+ exchanger-like protein